MSIEEIEEIYSRYEINALLPGCDPHSSDMDEIVLPNQVPPPSAFIKDVQIISNVSNP